MLQNDDPPVIFFSALMDRKKKIYVILNAGADPGIPERLEWLDAEYVSLYKGTPEEKYNDMAPYLVHLSAKGKNQAELEKWVSHKFMGRDRTIFVESRADINVLLTHFQKFTLVMDESGRGLFFRFYDPRVLRVYLPTCSPEESEYIFGPDIAAFFMESEDGGAALSVFQKKEMAKKTDAPAPRILIIRHEQMAAFDQNEREKFIFESISFLRETLQIWSMGKCDEDIRRFAKKMVDMAHRRNIHQEINIQKLMHYKIQYAYDIPESDYPGDRLGGEDLDEYQKVERLYFTLTKNQNLIEISLD